MGRNVEGKKEEGGALVYQHKEVEKENSFGMFSLHGCTGKSTTVRERETDKERERENNSVFYHLRQWPL